MSSRESTSDLSSINSGAIKSRMDTLSKYYTLILECVDIEKVWPYVEKHFHAEESNSQTMRDLLIVTTQKPRSPLYEDLMKALKETYPDFHGQIQAGVSPTCSVAEENPTKEENSDLFNPGPNSNVGSSQNNTQNISKTSTASASRTTSSPNSNEIKNRDHNIDRIFEKYGEELNEDHFVEGFLSFLSREDSSAVLRGTLSPFKELVYVLKQKINWELYNKFINYLNDKKPDIYEDIFVDESSLNDSRGRKRKCEGIRMPDDSAVASEIGTIHDNRTEHESDSLYENDTLPENEIFVNMMECTSPKRKHKSPDPRESDVENEQPNICLAFTKEDSMTHIIQSVEELVNGSLLSFTLSKHNLHYNNAIRLGQLLAKHIRLEDLSIEDNFITTKNLSALIKAITDMHRLASISLCGQSLGSPCFDYLQMCLKNNRLLEELTLDNCKIDSVGLRILSNCLKKHRLKILSLKDNGFGDASVGHLMNSLNYVSSLYSLSLDRNCISDAGCLIAGELLPQTDRAFYLSLRGNQISDNGAISLAKILKQRSKRSALNLAENQIGNEGAEQLVKAWVEKGCTGMLNLKGNQISKKVVTGNALVLLTDNKTGRDRAEIIATRIRNGEVYNTVELKGILLDDDSLKLITTALYLQSKQRPRSAITEGLPGLMPESVEMLEGEELTNFVTSTSWSGIVHLNISSNALTSKAMDELVELIRIDTIQSLDIGGNNFKATDFHKFSEAMHGNKSLKELHLKKSKITDEGAFHIATAMKYCKILEHVDLGENEIGGNGIVHISNALMMTNSLKALDINDNNIGENSGPESGLPHLVLALRENNTLHHLNLRSNKVGDVGLKQFSKAFPLSSLQTLNISNNEIGPGGALLFLTSTWRSNLRELDMSDNPVGVAFVNCVDQVRMHLQRIGSNLQVLRLRNTEITDTAVRNLISSTKSETTIDIASNNISHFVMQEFKRNHGGKVLFQNEE